MRQGIFQNTDFFLLLNTKNTKGTEVFRISCFRHLEKPIKTKEHKIKHFVFLLLSGKNIIENLSTYLKHLFLYVFIGIPLFF